MKNTEQKLKRLFDFQKFEKNHRLSKMIQEAESDGVMLSDEDLSLVNAAGEIERGRVNVDSGPGAAGIGVGKKE